MKCFACGEESDDVGECEDCGHPACEDCYDNAWCCFKAGYCGYDESEDDE